MIVGQRILARLAVVAISQAELARRVGMSQGAMHHLIAGRSRSSTHLHRIARELGTSPAYLTGEIDDPDVNALPAPAAPPPVIYMAVQLPPERALARMFSGLLRGLDPAASIDEQALLLAKRLPIGLSQLRDLQPEPTRTAAARRAPAAAAEAPAMPDREPTR